MVVLAVLLFIRARWRCASRRVARPRRTHRSRRGLDEETVAVLAASAWMALGAPVRIHRVHVHGEPAGQAWERAGRMDIMVSHRVGHK
jgi:hypothetical protein